MEEILASIRRIIADDQNEPAPAPAQVAAPADDAEDDDVLDLANAPQTWEEAAAEDDVEFREASEPLLVIPSKPAAPAAPEPPPAPVQPPPAPPAAPVIAPPPSDEALLAPAASATVASTFNMLSSAILTSQARTLEDLVKDMMRPMLKSWLDENLPGLVERLVKAEIERVTRGVR
ncbi:DUF2497 domain-containing protein [Alsobacter soli]|uniref:DUF2497 domain-containing protein n=2 Tax=Alsobacter soli TaxID=2109933 RepID=A0A2T1HW23_9HYPH|nr:DUF2497 domain-containing protein [Alsobacter soli]